VPAEAYRPTSSNMAGFGRSSSVSSRPAVPPFPFTNHSISFQMPKDVDTVMAESSDRSSAYVQTVPMPQHQSSSQSTDFCCSVSQGKAEIKAMLRNFQEDLDHVMTINFEEPLAFGSLRIPPVHVDPTSAPPPFLCSLCTQHRQGTWYSCDNCHIVVVRIDDL
jgi:next to BRCA1 gene 1 protein